MATLISSTSQHIIWLSNARTMWKTVQRCYRVIKNSNRVYSRQSSLGNAQTLQKSLSWTIWHWIYRHVNSVSYLTKSFLREPHPKRLVKLFLDLFACRSEVQNPLCQVYKSSRQRGALKKNRYTTIFSNENHKTEINSSNKVVRPYYMLLWPTNFVNIPLTWSLPWMYRQHLAPRFYKCYKNTRRMLRISLFWEQFHQCVMLLRPD